MEKEVDPNAARFVPSRNLLLGFFSISLFWLGIGTGICWLFTPVPDAARVAFRWMLLFWSVSVLDLLALGKTIAFVMNVIQMKGEKRAAAVIRTLSWGMLKLACIGVFIVLLINVSANPLPGSNLGLLTGLGTMVFVPLIGGLLWSQRILQHGRES